MKLYLARHTETNFNVLGLSNSDPAVDVHLTPRGLMQAELLAKKLEHIPLDVIITSLLPRTLETATIINENRDIPLVSDARLNDLNMGYEGQPTAGYYTARSKEHDVWTVRFNDGESLDDVESRVDQFLDWLEKQPYGDVLIVSHFTILQFVYGRLKNIARDKILEIEVRQGEFSEITL